MPSQRPAVILIHAAVVGKSSLALFARRLAGLGFNVFNLGYPNRRLDVFGCAEHLAPAVARLAAQSRGPVHLAGHSMGGLVARRLLELEQPPNFGRLVTMGTPHLGSPLADALHGFDFYKKLFGPAGQNLVTSAEPGRFGPWPPPYEIGLIAGSIPIGPGTFYLPWASDGTVTIKSAQPPGGSAYALVRATHTTIPYLKKTALLTARFFKSGSFEEGEIKTGGSQSF